MIGSYLIGILGVVFLMLGWTLVQSLWGRVFADDLDDEDVLADGQIAAIVDAQEYVKTSNSDYLQTKYSK